MQSANCSSSACPMAPLTGPQLTEFSLLSQSHAAQCLAGHVINDGLHLLAQAPLQGLDGPIRQHDLQTGSALENCHTTAAPRLGLLTRQGLCLDKGH